MSADYVEYDHENLRITLGQPTRLLHIFTVTSILTVLGDDAEITMEADSQPGAVLELLLPIKFADAFRLGQKFSMILTEHVELKPEG